MNIYAYMCCLLDWYAWCLQLWLQLLTCMQPIPQFPTDLSRSPFAVGFRRPLSLTAQTST